MTAAELKAIALQEGFALAGIARVEPLPESAHYLDWAARGLAGRMGYLTDHRGAMRSDPRTLLPSARSVLVVGHLYNAPVPYSTTFSQEECGWISRYAWGQDYHGVVRLGLERVLARLQSIAPCEAKICVDTAPLLERPLARRAGLGWLGKNTCLINQQQGSWFFLGEILLSLDLAEDAPPPDRCGSCTACIDACPTQAIVPTGKAAPAWELDSRACIAYLNIELKGTIPPEQRAGVGAQVFGCDICQDVCPWNRRAAISSEDWCQPGLVHPPLEQLAALSQEEFRALFAGTPVSRTRYQGFLRNVAVAMGNAKLPRFRAPLARLAASPDPVVAEHAQWALAQLPPA